MENKNSNGNGTGALPTEAVNGFLTYLQSNVSLSTLLPITILNVKLWLLKYSTMTQRARVASAFETLFGERRPAETILEHFDPLINRTAIPTEDLKKITQPVLILHGSEDAAAPLAAAEAMVELLPNGKFLCLRYVHETVFIITVLSPFS